MNRVQVEIGANVQGFVDGMNQADHAVKQYETDQKKIRDSLGNFKKEFAQAKREVMNLASAYSKLDATAKASAFGKEMAKQLEEAKIKAAEMVDMQGDLNQELKNMASDTRALDTLAEGMDVVGNVTAATLGIIAQFTGNEKDAQRAVVAFTTAQSALATVTKIASALQKQSNTMLAINKVQTLAATAATNMKTTAEGKGVVTTKAATIAQAAFNKIAMANPYVLLASAILTVVGALAAFIAFTHKSEAAEKAEAKAAEEAKSIKEAYYNTYNQKLTETMGNYNKLQQEWKNLKSEGEKTQWIKDNENAFHELGYAINNTVDAEKFFVENEQAVIESFNARAEAAAYAAQQIEIFNQALQGTPKAGEKISVKEASKYGININNREVTTHWLDDNEITLTKADEKKIREARLEEARQTSKELGEERISAEKKASEEAAKVGVKTYNKTKEKELKKTSKPNKIKTDVEIKVEKDSLTESEKELKKLEELRTKISIDNPDLPKLKKQIENLKKEIENKKIKLGIENEKTSVDFMSEYEKKLSDAVKAAESDYMEAYLKGQIEQLDKLWIAWNYAINAQKKYMSAKKIQSPDQGIESSGNIKLLSALRGIEKTIDLYNKHLEEVQKLKEITTDPRDIEELNNDLERTNNLLVDIVKHAVEISPKSIKGMQDDISVLQDKLMSTDFSKMGDELGTASIQEYIDKIVELKVQAAEIQEKLNDALLTPQEKAQKELEKTINTIGNVGDAVSACGDLFSALGELSDDTTFNVIGIVAKAVATVALSYAQALASCKTWVEWLAFGISGLATMASMIASIKSATSGYAEGGIVGGSSYSGDRILARVNSHEMILNDRQQRNLFNLLDSDVMPQKGGTNVTVTGVIRGTDLLLVQKNTNKVRSKSGTQIHF